MPPKAIPKGKKKAPSESSNVVHEDELQFDDDDEEVDTTPSTSSVSVSSGTGSTVDVQLPSATHKPALSLVSTTTSLTTCLIDEPFVQLETFGFVCSFNGSHPVDEIGNVVGRCKDSAFTSIVMSFFKKHPRDPSRSQEEKDAIWDDFRAMCSTEVSPSTPWTKHLDLVRASPKHGEGHKKFLTRFRQLATDVDSDLLLVSLLLNAFKDEALVRYAIEKKPKTLRDAFEAISVYHISKPPSGKRGASMDSNSSSSSGSNVSKRFKGGKKPKGNTTKKKTFPSSDGAQECDRCGRNNHTKSNCFAKYHIDGTKLTSSPPAKANLAQVQHVSSATSTGSPNRRVPPPPPPPANTKQVDIDRSNKFDLNGRLVHRESVMVVKAPENWNDLIHEDVIVNGVYMKALIDTGATRSLMRYHDGMVTYRGSMVKLELADGRVATSNHFVRANILWGCELVELHIPVIKGLGCKLLLGMDWLNKAKPILDFQTKILRAPEKGETTSEHIFSISEVVSSTISKFHEKYASVFNELDTMPLVRGDLDLDINLVDGAMPPKSRSYRLSSHEFSVMKQTISELLQKGWISPSTSPWVSPILFTKKKSGGLRMCVDFRLLNNLTIPDRYPLPLC